MQQIFVVAGPAGSGKTTVANYLELKGYKQIGLADPIKDICKTVFGWDDRRLFGPSEARNEPDPEWDGLTPRYALQQLGTEWGRACHPEVWLRFAARRIYGSGRRCVVSDVRFINELQFFKRYGADTLLLLGSKRPLEARFAAHASESEQWDSADFDHVIEEQPTVEMLLNHVDLILERIGMGSLTTREIGR